MSLPFFAMFPKDFEAKTSHLTLEEDGAYNRLLRLQWMTAKCKLPNDDQWIIRRMRINQDIFDRIVVGVLDEFFVRKRTGLYNAKLLEVYEKTCDLKNKRKKSGKTGGDAKALNLKKKKSSKTLPFHTQTHIKEKQVKEADLFEELDEENTIDNPEDNFNIFWAKYGKHGSRKKALEKFLIITRTTSMETLLDGLAKYEDHLKTEDWLRKRHLVTWLNQEGWVDEYSSGAMEAKSDEDDMWLNRIKNFVDNQRWNDDRWGLRPDHPRTTIPQKLLKQYGLEKKA